MMRNMAGMMKKLHGIQERLGSLQGELAALQFTAEVGGGAVSVVMNGDNQLAALKINPDAVDRDDIEMLEDMICLAMNNAQKQVADKKAAMLKDVTGGMPLPPGMNLPF